MQKKRCPHCNRLVVGHQNKKFCGAKCKDRFHNDADQSRKRYNPGVDRRIAERDHDLDR